MKILFFLVHPAKFHFHRVQINELISRGHDVDIIITKKDILEELVQEEGWEYTNIFPEGRKIPGLHVYLAALISLLRTVYRLLKYTNGKKYDLFVGDLLTIVGRLKGVSALYPTDDVLVQVPEQAVFLATTNQIIAPQITELGKYNSKKIGYKGYKALAHLHPNYFTPDKSRIFKRLRTGKDFFLIRCVKFGATHDIDKSGITNEILTKLVSILKTHGEIFITSERELPEELEKYRIKIRKKDISHYLYYAKMFIGDSTTMCSEAAVLGTPSVEFDDYFEEIEQMQELQDKYGLTFGMEISEPKKMFEKVEELLNTPNLNEEFQERRQKLLSDTVDVSAYLVWLYENYPESISKIKAQPDYQNRFNAKIEAEPVPELVS